MISSNAHRYPISALCRCLGITRSLYYYHKKREQKKCARLQEEQELSDEICIIFRQNREVYGSRKIKSILGRAGKQVSRRRIIRIMNVKDLVLQIRRKRPREKKDATNRAETGNVLDRQFDGQEPYAAVVSDLTYVRVGGVWNYVCILLDLFNREIIGYSAGRSKDAQLVYKAFASVSIPLYRMQLFHTDRGSEFDNRLIEEVLQTFQIERSLSRKATPHDNAVAESAFNLVKSEFINRNRFDSLAQLRLQLMDYVNWYNKIRVHSSLGYLSPSEYREIHKRFCPGEEGDTGEGAVAMALMSHFAPSSPY